MSERLTGSDVTVTLFRSGNPLLRLNRIKEATFEFEVEEMDDGYLGQDHSEPDSIFKMVSISLSAHMSSKDYVAFAEAVLNKLRDRQSAVVFSISAKLAYPVGGGSNIFVFPDVRFGNIPIKAGSRTEFVSIDISGKCGTYKILTT